MPPPDHIHIGDYYVSHEKRMFEVIDWNPLDNGVTLANLATGYLSEMHSHYLRSWEHIPSRIFEGLT